MGRHQTIECIEPAWCSDRCAIVSCRCHSPSWSIALLKPLRFEDQHLCRFRWRPYIFISFPDKSANSERESKCCKVSRYQTDFSLTAGVTKLVANFLSPLAQRTRVSQ